MIKIEFFVTKFDTENSKRGILFIGSPGTRKTLVQKLRNLLGGGGEVIKRLHRITGGPKKDYVIFEWSLTTAYF